MGRSENLFGKANEARNEIIKFPTKNLAKKNKRIFNLSSTISFEVVLYLGVEILA